MIDDTEQRQQALDITRSFIVQAPAGSGKTELLTRRFVNLLQHVDHPEEIIAITFTRKAAAEMRHRIQKHCPGFPVYRLRIMTIDAFCSFLCTQLPLKSKLSENFNVTDNADNLYTTAIQNLFSYHQYLLLEYFLLYLDNNFTRIKDLLINILKNRDQWLVHIFTLEAISHLEQGLSHVIQDAHEKTKHFIPIETLTLLQSQQENIADLFLTKQGTLRKKLPKGFDTISAEFESHLKNLQHLPSASYSPSQKKFIQALSALLPLLIAELQLVFKETQQYDFIEVALRASDALGGENTPTDLALKLDYHIKHLLIDEFQDTSLSQWRLLQKLTSGWEINDGRTLFLVGDPMQSIYRFRKAEVGLFLKVKENGIHHLPLTSLTLTSNFRSDHSLVEWFNNSFSQIFPKNSDASQGAIAYSPSVGQHQQNANTVFIHSIDNQQQTESKKILGIIKQHPDQSIGILVRSRAHLKEIIPYLQVNKISFRAVEITQLHDNSLIQDLLSLTKALSHPGDRIAWLSLLRAPWCGLTLDDLLCLSHDPHEETILDNLLSITKKDVSEDSYIRIQHFLNAIQWAISQRGRISLRKQVEHTWMSLKGSLCLENPQDLKIAEMYFDLLDEVQDTSMIEQQLSRLSAPTETQANVNIDIMTIHKAKGLEFDVVILPGLDKAIRADSSQLFLWAERLNTKGTSDLLIAPIREAHEQKNDIYDYLKFEEMKRAEYELQRLLYVACTRAKNFLHLVFSTNISKPASRSFLEQLWPLLSDNISLNPPTEKNPPPFTPPLLRRLPIEVITANI